VLPSPAHYFPVRPTPFRFQAGLMPFGTDFGNGERDRQYFQIDDQRDRYLAAKRRVRPERHGHLERDAAERRVHERVLTWIGETICREHRQIFRDPPDSYRAAAMAIQEDFVVMHRRRNGSNAAIAVYVSFPSDWRPERIIGTDFRFIHGPVPGFADGEVQANSLVNAMIDRGPYVRFVWTIKPDAELDLHPEEGRHSPWPEDQDPFLRVERQITVPFAAVDAALFLIRTYLYDVSHVAPEQRQILEDAVASMPNEIARYKGIAALRQTILQPVRGK
jgi:hypothetical protein